MIGASLYELSPRDQATTGLEAVAQSEFAEGFVSSLNVAFRVPADRCLLLKNVSVHAQPGTGQSALIIAASIVFDQWPAVEQNLARIRIEQSVRDFSHALPDVIVPGGAEIRAFSTFDGSANINRMRLSVLGVSIPRGTIALGGLLSFK